MVPRQASTVLLVVVALALLAGNWHHGRGPGHGRHRGRVCAVTMAVPLLAAIHTVCMPWQITASEYAGCQLSGIPPVVTPSNRPTAVCNSLMSHHGRQGFLGHNCQSQCSQPGDGSRSRGPNTHPLFAPVCITDPDVHQLCPHETAGQSLQGCSAADAAAPHRTPLHLSLPYGTLCVPSRAWPSWVLWCGTSVSPISAWPSTWSMACWSACTAPCWEQPTNKHSTGDGLQWQHGTKPW